MNIRCFPKSGFPCGFSHPALYDATKSANPKHVSANWRPQPQQAATAPPQKKAVRSLAADPTDESYPLSMNLSKGFKNTCINVYAFSNENMIFSTIKF